MTLSIKDTQHYSECCYAECRYAECRYAECHYAECRNAECRGATTAAQVIKYSLKCLSYKIG